MDRFEPPFGDETAGMDDHGDHGEDIGTATVAPTNTDDTSQISKEQG